MNWIKVLKEEMGVCFCSLPYESKRIRWKRAIWKPDMGPAGTLILDLATPEL
jgi:hypothetical protein